MKYLVDNTYEFDTAEETAEFITEEMDETTYNELLDETYGEIEVCGLKFSASYALSTLDETAYRRDMLDYYDDLAYEIETDIAWMKDGEEMTLYGFKVEAKEEDMKERAIKAILDYFESEYGVEDRELEDDPSRIGVIYTTDGTDEHEFQWYVDVNKMEMWLEIDGKPTGYREPFEVEFFEDAPRDVFDTYTGIAEEVLEEMEAKDADK